MTILTKDVSSSGWIIRLVADTKGIVPGFELVWAAVDVGLAPTVIQQQQQRSSSNNNQAAMKEVQSEIH